VSGELVNQQRRRICRQHPVDEGVSAGAVTDTAFGREQLDQSEEDTAARKHGVDRTDRCQIWDHDCPAPRIATSSAIAETAFGLVTMPMWLMPSITLTSTDGFTACTVSAYLSETIISSSAAPKIVTGRVVAGRSTRYPRVAKLRSRRSE